MVVIANDMILACCATSCIHVLYSVVYCSLLWAGIRTFRVNCWRPT